VAKLVQLPQSYSIDATEVTRSQYEAWLATSPATSGQPGYCQWNTTFTPSPACTSKTDVCKTNCDNHPQVCVDWCDAYAYCAAVGKRLCGKVGGGPSGYDDYKNASLSQWYNACVSGGANNAYPYGNAYQGQACNGLDAGKGTTVPVGSMSECQSKDPGFKGVLDLSGNVYEWEDACNGTSGIGDSCRGREGSFAEDASKLRCDFVGDGTRDFADPYLGLRCCAP
jgi:formylglycine-generating enzyme required for sulfatase activity